jgi:hypothetical protein
MEIALTAADISSQNAHGECSTRAVANATGIPKSTVWKAMRKILQQFPYRIQILHELLPGDPPRRLAFAQEFLARVALDDNWLDSILWSDEAHFHLSGQVNKKNCVIWANENPHSFAQQPLHDKKVTVWCGVTANFILGPYFFHEPDGNGVLQTVTVNGPRYESMLVNFVIPALQARNVLATTTFMQDGATPHIARPVRAVLTAAFDNRIISRMFPDGIDWPARSPDLTPLDYWFWGMLKANVYQLQRPPTLQALRNSITQCVASITPDQLRNGVYHSVARMQAIIDNGGRHIEHLMP